MNTNDQGMGNTHNEWSAGQANLQTVSSGVIQSISVIPLFSQFFSQKFHWFPIENNAHIWQVSPHLSCDDTRQIRQWFKEPNNYIYKIKMSLNQRTEL